MNGGAGFKRAPLYIALETPDPPEGVIMCLDSSTGWGSFSCGVGTMVKEWKGEGDWMMGGKVPEFTIWRPKLMSLLRVLPPWA